MKSGLPLFERFPTLAARLPREPLGKLPTPLTNEDPAAAALGVGALAVKRDDLSAPEYGGNKVRKLEFLLAAARERGCDAVLTFGAVASNHVLATAIHARRLGLGCYAVLTPQPPTPDLAGKLRWHAQLGTRLSTAPDLAGVRARTAQIVAGHPGGPSRVYRIPWGGSSWRGTAGFVNAALELAAQAGDAPPDRVYAAAGTLGTVAGLALGFRLLGWRTRVVAVRVVPPAVMSPQAFGHLFARTADELAGRAPDFPRIAAPFANVEFRDEFFGPGYAVATPAAREALDLADQLLGIALDTTYTAKAMAALVADARAGRLAGRRVTFWQTRSSRPVPRAPDPDPADLPAELAALL